jgi:hypothetical protein
VARVHLLTMNFPRLQEVPPTEPIDQGDEGEWDMVGEAAGNRSPAPTIEELLAQMERQPPARQESTGPAATAAKEEMAAEAQESAAPTAVAAEEAAAAGAQEEAPAETGMVDIASILGAPTVMVVRSSL